MISEFLRTIQDITSMTDDQISHSMNRRHYTSIAERSLEGTLQFPTIVTDSLDIETIQIVTKALEKQFASFVQTALTMNPFIDLKTDKDAAGYLRKFHKNMGTTSNVRNDVLNLISVVGENYTAYGGDNITMLTTTMEGASLQIVKENAENLRNVLEGLNPTTVQSLYTPHHIKRSCFVKGMSVSESTTINNKNTTVHNNNTADHRFEVESPNIHINRLDVKGKGSSQYDGKLPNRVLVDNDVKKANELVPTTMHVRTIMTSDGRPYGNLDFIAGIKATMHPVSSAEIVDNIHRAVTRGGSFFKTLRLTSGEIKFMKDYIMNLTEIRDDVTGTQKSSKWWNALKRRRRLAKFKRRTLLPGDIHPTASIVISIEEAEYLKNEMNLDVMDYRTVRRLMDEYFLISFTVVDTATGVVHFLFDGFDGYQSVSFSGLERGDTSSSTDFKDVMKLISRV